MKTTSGKNVRHKFCEFDEMPQELLDGQPVDAKVLVNDEFQSRLAKGSDGAFEAPRNMRKTQFMDIWGISRGDDR